MSIKVIYLGALPVLYCLILIIFESKIMLFYPANVSLDKCGKNYHHTKRLQTH
jgi:5'-3' exonuclease